MTFNAHQDQEDGYSLFMAICIIVGLICAYIVGTHYDTGLVYWLLSNWGQSVEGTVALIEKTADFHSNRDNSELLDQVRKNSSYYYDNYLAVFDYSTIEGTRHSLEVLFEIEEHPITANSEITIQYFPWRPEIAHPTSWLSDFQFDAKLLKWATLGLCATIFGFLVTLHRYRLFKRNMRRY